jgi:lipopolysaccharide/colanic/teichoic acid biosynthesis glycosyltransferase
MSASAIVKRVVDLVVAGTALIVLSPVVAGIAVAILLGMGRPILFRQKRAGYRARPFDVFKFRTMRDAVDQDGNPLPDGERLTGLGRFLRRFSLDEIPQLLNVIRGEMSLVGPRPLLYEYVDRYTAEQMRRHDVRPGITGLAQVRGRNALAWERRFALDTWYADHWTLWLDARILSATIVMTLRGAGISGDGVPTMTKFGEQAGDCS